MSIDSDICSICQRMKKNKTTGDSCRHSFCYECILKWCRVKNECPLSKSVIMKLILV